jgi:hypothetical protein
MLNHNQRRKLAGEWDDLEGKATPQKKADFNKNMKRKMKLWLKELPDMIIILESLPPKVIENANLQNDLPKLIDFFNSFLEKVDPLPVAEHESGEMRVFLNTVKKIDGHSEEVNGLENNGYVKIINDNKYLAWSVNWTAAPLEVARSKILKKHVENMQKYVDPSIITRDHSLHADMISSNRDKFKERAGMLGPTHLEFRRIKFIENMPTNPPCQPRIIIQEDSPSDKEESK